MSSFSETQTLQPGEWQSHRACWLAWPSHANLWEENLPAAQAEFTALCRTISLEGSVGSTRPQEHLEILVPTAEARKQAETALQGLPVRFHNIAFGDIWMRDTGPIFVFDSQGQVALTRFKFNGWGEKYVLPYDREVSTGVSLASRLPTQSYDWVLEGGSIEADGEGTLLTTKQCLLNPNRNPGMTQQQIEEGLGRSLGTQKVLWLGDGMLNDHTDGHIDTIARFIAPGVAMCMEAQDSSDPNKKVFEEIIRNLESFTDARGRKLKVIRVPSPGKILDEEGEIMPASYMNFYIANHSVVVPTYGSRFDEVTVSQIAKHFPDRKTVGLSAKAILSGGGAFHCITQQEPISQEIKK